MREASDARRRFDLVASAHSEIEQPSRDVEAPRSVKRRDALADQLCDLRAAGGLPRLDPVAKLAQDARAFLARPDVGGAVDPRPSAQARDEVVAAQRARFRVVSRCLHVRSIGGRIRGRTRGTNAAILRPCVRGYARGIGASAARSQAHITRCGFSAAQEAVSRTPRSQRRSCRSARLASLSGSLTPSR
jgi:hypothetical protein